MARRKLQKITEVRTFENVFDSKSENIKVELADYFKDQKPYILELGCGQADYSINMAKLFTRKYFIGVDRKPNRIWNASKNADQDELRNVGFLISYIERLDQTFDHNSVEEIWITFPDPYPRSGYVKKRLTHPRFLAVYKNILVPNGVINLKTDDDTLYEYTLEVIKENNLNLIKETNDLYSRDDLNSVESIKTKYEKQHIANGKKIKLISFSL